MSFTQRKLNRLKKAEQYKTLLKKYSKQPVIKNVDIEAIKSEFASKKAASDTAPKSKTSKKKTEEVETSVEEQA